MRRGLMVVALLLVALAVRIPHLDATGLSEDEMDKLHAADAYGRGVFAVDGEHPALMKLAVFSALRLSRAWNAHAPAARHIPTETAVRAPNAMAGALIAVVLFLLAEQFFGVLAGLMAGWLWAFDIGAIAINRIAKEDTFALLFLLLGALLYERAKRVGAVDDRRAQRWFAASGAAFGLMLASKYVPYLFGIHAIYFRLADPKPGMNRPDKPVYLGALACAFVAANFPILDPDNWVTILAFLQEHAVTHSGYVFQGQLWANRLSATPWGLPPWFYVAQLFTKMPVLILLSALIGMVHLARTRSSRGSIFVLTFTVLTLAPLSLAATKFLRYMLPTLAMIDIAAGAALAWLLSAAWRSAAATRAAACAAAAVVLLAAAGASLAAQPFPGLYRNAVGRTLSPTALWFPPDEFYDAGMREATARIARDASPGAVVVTEAPQVVGFYAVQNGRSDLVIARPPGPDPVEPRAGSWLIVQEGRRYFENDAAIRHARLTAPEFAIDVDGFRAVEVYRLGVTSTISRSYRNTRMSSPTATAR